jgi:hypothetical protein
VNSQTNFVNVLSMMSAASPFDLTVCGIEQAGPGLYALVWRWSPECDDRRQPLQYRRVVHDTAMRTLECDVIAEHISIAGKVLWEFKREAENIRLKEQ